MSLIVPSVKAGVYLEVLSGADFQTAASVNQLATMAMTTALNNVMLGLINPSGFGSHVNAFVSVAGVTPQHLVDVAEEKLY